MHQAQWSPERPLPPPVSLASQSHHEKPPEVTCTSRGNPGFPVPSESPGKPKNTGVGSLPFSRESSLRWRRDNQTSQETEKQKKRVQVFKLRNREHDVSTTKLNTRYMVVQQTSSCPHRTHKVKTCALALWVLLTHACLQRFTIYQ